MEKIITEIFTAFKEKISSPFFRYFTISWILWNYKFVYFIAFLDEKVYFEAHKITKFDYLMNCNFYPDYWGWLFFLVFPILSTLFFIYLFPYINIYFLGKYDKTIKEEDELKYDYKKFIKNKDIELKKLEVEEKKEEIKVIKEEVKKTKATKEIKTLENTKINDWNKEYEEFKKSQVYKDFGNIIEKIHHHNGYFLDNYNNFVINKNSISYLLANKVIEKSAKSSDYHLFTEKGEYFAKLYFEENNK